MRSINELNLKQCCKSNLFIVESLNYNILIKKSIENV